MTARVKTLLTSFYRWPTSPTLTRLGVACLLIVLIMGGLWLWAAPTEANSVYRPGPIGPVGFPGRIAVVSVVRELSRSEGSQLFTIRYMREQKSEVPWYGHEVQIERSYPDFSSKTIWIYHQGVSTTGHVQGPRGPEYASAFEKGKRYLIELGSSTAHEFGTTSSGKKIPAYRIWGGDIVAKGNVFPAPMEVPPLRTRHKNLSLDVVWDLLVHIYDRRSDTDSGVSVDVEKQFEIAKSGTPAEASIALAHLYVAEGDPLTSQRMLEVVKARYRRLRETYGDTFLEGKNFSDIEGWDKPPMAVEVRNFHSQVRALLTVSTPIASEAEIQAWYAFYAADLKDLNGQVLINRYQLVILPELVPLLCRLSPAARIEKLQELVELPVLRYVWEGNRGPIEVETRGLLLVDEYAAIRFLESLSHHTSDEAGEFLRAILENPESVGLTEEWLMERASTGNGTRAAEYKEKRAKTDAFKARLNLTKVLDNAIEELVAGVAGDRPFNHGMLWLAEYLAEPNDKRLLPVLLNMDRPENMARFIRWKLPDPALIPRLRESLERNDWDRPVLQAMYVCGAEEETLAYARTMITAYLEASPESMPRRDMHNLCGSIAFLGEFGEAADRGLLRQIAARVKQPDLLEQTRIDGPETDVYVPNFPHPRLNARFAALLALARLKDPESIPLLREWYSTGLPNEKTAAAVALWYMGDETGKPLLDAYADRNVFTVLPLSDYALSGFSTGFMYLRSERTDEMVLRRFEKGYLEYGDMYNLAFLMEHANRILPIAARGQLHPHLVMNPKYISGLKRFFGDPSLYSTPGDWRGPSNIYPVLVDAYLANWKQVVTSSP